MLQFIDTGSFISDDEAFDTKTLIEIDSGNKRDEIKKQQNTSFYSNLKRRKRNILIEKEQLQSPKYFQEDIDECDLYCQLLAKKFKKLDENQRDIAMHEIDNIMFQIKRGLTNNINNSSDSLLSNQN